MQFKIAYFMYYYVPTCKVVSFAGGECFFLKKYPKYIFITPPEYRLPYKIDTYGRGLHQSL